MNTRHRYPTRRLGKSPDEVKGKGQQNLLRKRASQLAGPTSSKSKDLKSKSATPKQRKQSAEKVIKKSL